MSEGKKLGTRIEKKIIETPVKLSDDQIRKVSGGFAEYEGYAAGHVIICPNCGNEYEPNFVWWMEDNCAQNGYCWKNLSFKHGYDLSDTGYYYDEYDNMLGYVSF